MSKKNQAPDHMTEKKFVNLQSEDSYLSAIREKTEERFVLLIDVMGFSEMVLSGRIKEVQKVALTLHEISSSAGLIDYKESKSKETQFIQTALFSDTIIAWTEKDNTLDLYAILHATSVIMNSLFEKGIPFRGAIAKGKFSADKERSIYVGKPLVDAYRLSESLEFFGTVLHHSADKSLPTFPEMPCYWSKIPIKKGGAIGHNVVGFPMTPEEPRNRVPTPASYSLQRLRFESSGETRKYIENSIEVYEKIEAGYRSDQTPDE